MMDDHFFHVDALMEGQRIDLEDRRNYTPANRWIYIKRSEDEDDDEDEVPFYTSQTYHNYSFCFARPKLSDIEPPSIRNQPPQTLNITQLELPIETKDKNNNTILRTAKRPRNKLGLKPLKLLTTKSASDKNNLRTCIKCGQLYRKPPPTKPILSDTNATDKKKIIINIQKQEQEQEDSYYSEDIDGQIRNPYEDDDDDDDEKPKAPNYDINDVDFDFDVLRLIIDDEERNAARRPDDKHTAHIAPTAPSRRNNKKKIRFTVSAKPQSPRTVQVIRVDVTTTSTLTSATTSTSQHTDDEGDADDDCTARFRRDYGLMTAGARNVCRCRADAHRSRLCEAEYCRRDKEFVVMCKKLTLANKT